MQMRRAQCPSTLQIEHVRIRLSRSSGLIVFELLREGPGIFLLLLFWRLVILHFSSKILTFRSYINTLTQNNWHWTVLYASEIPLTSIWICEERQNFGFVTSIGLLGLRFSFTWSAFTFKSFGSFFILSSPIPAAWEGQQWLTIDFSEIRNVMTLEVPMFLSLPYCPGWMLNEYVLMRCSGVGGLNSCRFDFTFLHLCFWYCPLGNKVLL